MNDVQGDAPTSHQSEITAPSAMQADELRVLTDFDYRGAQDGL